MYAERASERQEQRKGGGFDHRTLLHTFNLGLLTYRPTLLALWNKGDSSKVLAIDLLSSFACSAVICLSLARISDRSAFFLVARTPPLAFTHLAMIVLACVVRAIYLTDGGEADQGAATAVELQLE